MSSNIRIMKVARWLYWVVVAVLAALPFIVLWLFAQSWAQPELAAQEFKNLPPETQIDPSKSLAVTLLTCVALVPLTLAILQMRGLFDRYRHGEILTDACARHILRMGQFLLANAAIVFVLPTLKVLVLTYDNPPGARMLTVAIHSNTVSVFLTAGLLMVIGWALSDAARIADENAGFV